MQVLRSQSQLLSVRKCHQSCVFSCPEDTVMIGSSLTSASGYFSSLSSVMVLEIYREEIYKVQCDWRYGEVFDPFGEVI